MIHIKIINGVRMSSETGHALKWDGVHYEQQIVNKAMNHLCCWMHLFWQQFLNNDVLYVHCSLHNYSSHIQAHHTESQHKCIVNCQYEIILGKLAYLWQCFLSPSLVPRVKYHA